MELFILTLVVLSVGLSECFDSLHPPSKQGYTAEQALEAFFNILDKDLNVTCDQLTDTKTRMDNVSQALEALSKAVIADQAWNGDFQYQKDVIKAAMPCAKQEELDEKLRFYKLLPNQDHHKE